LSFVFEIAGVGKITGIETNSGVGMLDPKPPEVPLSETERTELNAKDSYFASPSISMKRCPGLASGRISRLPRKWSGMSAWLWLSKSSIRRLPGF
jgi:hypothetical protein